MALLLLAIVSMVEVQIQAVIQTITADSSNCLGRSSYFTLLDEERVSYVQTVGASDLLRSGDECKYTFRTSSSEYLCFTVEQFDSLCMVNIEFESGPVYYFRDKEISCSTSSSSMSWCATYNEAQVRFLHKPTSKGGGGINVRVKVYTKSGKNAKCWASGDPHYTTFDGKHYDFQGACTYTLARDASPASKFDITVENVPCGTGVTCTSSVVVRMFGTTVKLLQGMAPMIDNYTVNKAEYRSQGITITKSGLWFFLHSSKLKVTVQYDKGMRVFVHLGSNWKNNVEGLCGNYDGRQDNEFNGAKTAEEFGNTWKTNTQCPNVLPPPPHTCNGVEHLKCALIKNDDVFGECREKMDDLVEDIYYQDCLYDACRCDGCDMGGDCQCLCTALGMFAEKCNEIGVPVSWRNQRLCPLQCDNSMVYTACGPPCPQTCQNSVDDPEPYCDSTTCVEGCFCPSGYVQHDDACIPVTDCPCMRDGVKYPTGTSIVSNCMNCICVSGKFSCTGKNCTGVCADGEFVCDNGDCISNDYVCDGVSNCHDGSDEKCKAKCWVSGDPHYTTFDGQHYSFQGACTYTLARDASSASKFDITVKNVKCGTGATCTRSVVVRMFGTTVKLLQGMAPMIDNYTVNTAEYRSQGLTITKSKPWIFLHSSKLKVTVQYDKGMRVFVHLGSNWKNNVEGLCGNYDGRQDNEFNGAKTAEEFGNTWKTNTQCPNVLPPAEHTCNGVEHQKCALIKNNDVFGECREKMDDQVEDIYYQDCLYDACRCDGCDMGGDCECLCTALGMFAEKCNEIGVPVSWRNQGLCPLQCDNGMVYTACGSPCPQTCQNIVDEPEPYCDSTTCVEGCLCPSGFVQHGDAWFPATDCPCMIDSVKCKELAVIVTVVVLAIVLTIVVICCCCKRRNKGCGTMYRSHQQAQPVTQATYQVQNEKVVVNPDPGLLPAGYQGVEPSAPLLQHSPTTASSNLTQLTSTKRKKRPAPSPRSGAPTINT